ncbi:hypothetical protein A8F94_13045 [Bacillus sp. FJAT-27225]|uniref:GNAT family N-acetyltransferase n=1 Tax=Bacillus sp. FJAT-27225 TaxID=1743144 RepID=UPI00080C29F5|nr:GNAT family N-acetyltransferase [Bacillus sp. FJAT-27225]OCA85793.1 hypothetical protein A8F94_13045 [Bacillus sp. FJAT-27225]
MEKNWYDKLREYFPAREMKPKEQIETLLAEKAEYKMEEGPDYILLYEEKQDYLFIDYILIKGAERGKGKGTKLLEHIKRKRKPIILEVEPVDEKDSATRKRIQFYKKNGFKEASSIQYRRHHPRTGELAVMDVYYWSQSRKPDAWVLEKMKEVYTGTHTYKAERFFNSPAEPAEAVLQLAAQDLSKVE